MSVDYFGKYFNDEKFDFSSLINDDFFQPVRILFQNRRYVSAAKLLFIAIDSIGYIEFGEVKENSFIKWLKIYADIPKLGITPEELWEHRNSLLHMSNLHSNKVKQGKVRKLVLYVGNLPNGAKLDEADTGYYDLQKLIIHFGQACGKWLNTYGELRDKIDLFVKRYDLIASDARMLEIRLK